MPSRKCWQSLELIEVELCYDTFHSTSNGNRMHPYFQIEKVLSLLTDADTLSSTLSADLSAVQFITPLGVSGRELVDSLDWDWKTRLGCCFLWDENLLFWSKIQTTTAEEKQQMFQGELNSASCSNTWLDQEVNRNGLQKSLKLIIFTRLFPP